MLPEIPDFVFIVDGLPLLGFQPCIVGFAKGLENALGLL